MSELPKGWVNTSISQCFDLKNGYAFKSTDYIEDGDFVVRIGNVQDGHIVLSNPAYVDAAKLGASSFSLTERDILVSLTGNVGRIGMVSKDHLPAVLNQRVAKICVVDSVEVRWLFYLLRTHSFQKHVLSLAKGAAQLNISTKDIQAFKFALPSLVEQKRIVVKLDEVLAQVNAIKARLDRIPAILKSFRQSVLAAAVSGKLTEEWRLDNAYRKPELSSFAKYWEKEYSLSGKKYSPSNISQEIRTNLCLPDNWLDTCIGNVFDVHVGATPSRKESIYWNGDIPWVSSGEVAFSFISDTAEKITESGLSNSSTKLHPKGTVMLAMIGQGKTRGQPAILRIEAAHNQNTAAMRIPEGMCVSEFLYYCLWEKYEETRRIGSGNNQKALNKSAVQHLHFPCPPYEEQKEIVRLVNHFFAFADTIEAQVKKAQTRVDNLTQSILAKAFRGELVAQDPSDEPAEKLLTRIAKARIEADALAKTVKKAGSKKAVRNN